MKKMKKKFLLAFFAIGVFLIVGIGLSIAHMQKTDSDVNDDGKFTDHNMMAICSKMFKSDEIDEETWEDMERMHEEHHGSDLGEYEEGFSREDMERMHEEHHSEKGEESGDEKEPSRHHGSRMMMGGMMGSMM